MPGPPPGLLAPPWTEMRKKLLYGLPPPPRPTTPEEESQELRVFRLQKFFNDAFTQAVIQERYFAYAHVDTKEELFFKNGGC